MVVAIIYVDNTLFCGPNKAILDEVKAHFMQKWKCRDLGEACEFLHMHICWNGHKISIDQCTYLNTILQHCRMANAKSMPTLLPARYYLMPNMELLNTVLQSRFQQVMRSLLYLSLGTCPDIACAVIALAYQSANPSEDHFNKALYICCYLIRMWNYSLDYDGHSRLGIMACTDSNWGSNPTSCHSKTGYFSKIAGRLSSWSLHVQKSIALSSTEAEYMVLSDCSHQAIWIWTLLHELGYKEQLISICGNNQGSIFMASNPITEKHTKHINIWYHFVYDVVLDNKVQLYYIKGSENPTDMFIKNLEHIKFSKFWIELRLHFY